MMYPPLNPASGLGPEPPWTPATGARYSPHAGNRESTPAGVMRQPTAGGRVEGRINKGGSLSSEVDLETKALHDVAQQIVKDAEVNIPEDTGVVVITFKRKPDTTLAIAATVLPDLAMEIIDHCAHSGEVKVVSIDGVTIPPGSWEASKGVKQ